ncbi:MAG: alpha-glucuronidase family glycosyl hydrolase, partial [Candidatus Hydrogenedentes bacterium]|nr:alpha-glucuronidase family glycosyl hydrolase [Candidatus Hydrogenedentota bacterium]
MRSARYLFIFSMLFSMSGFATPGIFTSPDASAIERVAAQELQRYWFAVHRQVLPVESASSVPDNATGFVVATSERLPKMAQAWPFGLDVPRDDGYILQTIRDGKQALVVVTALTPAGVQNGVYGLLEK